MKAHHHLINHFIDAGYYLAVYCHGDQLQAATNKPSLVINAVESVDTCQINIYQYAIPKPNIRLNPCLGIAYICLYDLSDNEVVYDYTDNALLADWFDTYSQLVVGWD